MSKENNTNFVKRTRWSREAEGLQKQLEKLVYDKEKPQLPEDPIIFCNEILDF
jgi:hypothetical protein